VFAYSRLGYGYSSPATLPRTLGFMHVEARDTLPRLLDAIDFRHGLLVGHSDGASIAAIYAGSVQDHRMHGLVLMAPHFIVEDVTMKAITAVRNSYDTTDVRTRFQRWHADADATVRGWSDVWLNNDTTPWDLREDLAYIRVPMLIVQGEDDDYGTVRQIEIAQEECYCPVEVLLMPGVKHVPHREAPEATLSAIADFARRMLREHQQPVAAR
jgi:pimeloyl-ACP methyl ester carboxylesterase